MRRCNSSLLALLACFGSTLLLAARETAAKEAPDGQASRPVAESDPPIRDRYLAKVSLFTPLEFHHDGRALRFRLFTPRKLERNTLYPLIVWFHGDGESGDDNQRHLVYIQNEVMRRDSQDGGFRCFVLAMQSGSGFDDTWNDMQLSNVLQLIRHSVSKWPIDENRIYAAGVSSGGNACWQVAEKYPEVFAALVPMASMGTSSKASFKIPIWVFHSLTDPAISPSQVQATVAAVQAQGGACWLTLTSGKTHDCWTEAFRDYDAIGWLLNQRRGEPAVPPPLGGNRIGADRDAQMGWLKILLAAFVSIAVITPIGVRCLAKWKKAVAKDAHQDFKCGKMQCH